MREENFESINPGPDLRSRILLRIKKAENAAEMKRKIFGFSFMAVSLSSFAYFSMNVVTELSNSGFYKYFSLIFTDGKFVLSNFGDYFLTIVDSIPFLEMTIITALIAAILLSVRFTFGKDRFPMHALRFAK